MEILTLLKANIKKKKGTFISIVVLTIIIVTSMTAIFSMKDNYEHAIEQAFEDADYGNAVIYVLPEYLTEELCSSVENSSLVERVKYFDTICADKASCGSCTDNNSWFMMEMRDGIKLFNEALDGFEETIPALKSGEIYVPVGTKTSLSCQVGDMIDVMCLDGIHAFKIKGFVQEPFQGADNIGWKQVFISREDFDSILASCSILENEEASVAVTMLMIYKADNYTLSDAKFNRELNLETKIITNAIGVLSKDDSMRYTGLLFKISSYVLMVFVGMLFIVVLIVMSHNISTEIEIDYVGLGILKSQGFTKGKIRGIMVVQYLLAELLGIIIGSVAAIPVERGLSRIMMNSTAILPDTGISMGKSVLLILLLLLVSAAIIFIKTGKVSRISPVKAISGGREEIYFDSRFNIPVYKKALSVSLAIRQFTSNRKRYAGTLMIVALLTFFMMSVNLIANTMTSRRTLEAMGMEIVDLEVRYEDRCAEEYIEEIEALVESYSSIEKKYYLNSMYLSINGESLRCDCYKYPEYMAGILKGRVPLYDNEIVISEMISDALDIKMGDEVTIANMDKEAIYIISGIYQTANDSGLNFAMSFEGAKKLGIEITPYLGFVLADASLDNEIADALNERFGDILRAEPVNLEEDGIIGESIALALAAIRAVIYSFSVLFALVVVRMVCSKAFVQERIDIGIYKAMGFTSTQLRFQFAVRFLVVALLGAVIGIGLSAAFSAKLIGSFLGQIGLSKVVLKFSVTAVLIPIVVVGVCFLVFAYLVSRKIQSVAIKELVVE